MQNEVVDQNAPVEKKKKATAHKTVGTSIVLSLAMTYIALMIFGSLVVNPLLYVFNSNVELFHSPNLNMIKCTNVTMEDAISWTGEVDFTVNCTNPYGRDVNAEFISEDIVYDRGVFPRVLTFDWKTNIFLHREISDVAIKFADTKFCMGYCNEVYRLDLSEYHQELDKVMKNWIGEYRKRFAKDFKGLFNLAQCMALPFRCGSLKN